MFASLLAFMHPAKPGQSPETALEIKAVPGMTTLLDVALYHANEGQLTATICSSHALLRCWLDIKLQSQLVLNCLSEDMDSSLKTQCDSFVRLALECAMDAMERLSTDKLAQSANLSDAYESTSSGGGSGHHHHHHNYNTLLSGVGAQGIAAGILAGKDESGRRTPSLFQRRMDCWESPRLHCPDFCWADDVFFSCQRWIRNLLKHHFITNENDSLAPSLTGNSSSSKEAYSNHRFAFGIETEKQLAVLIQLIQDDLSMRLFHFKRAMEADSVVTKRLYLVKCEYRAPFRAFLEAHQSLLKAPPMELVESCLQHKGGKSKGKGEDYKKKLQVLLETPQLVELLALERECEQLELDLGQAFFPFAEMARSLDHKRARLKIVHGVVDEEDLPELQETTRRLKSVLCRRNGSDTSTGIRPILVDVLGVSRDDELSSAIPHLGDTSLEERVDFLMSQLQTLSTLIKTKRAFAMQKQQHHDIDFSFSVVKGCTEEFDATKMKLQILDWFTMAERQHELMKETGTLPDEIRQTEIAVGIAGAKQESLGMVKERLEKMRSDREHRLEVFKSMVEELCLREMHLCINITGPDPDATLLLKDTSALGFLGIPLKLAGESLPIG